MFFLMRFHCILFSTVSLQIQLSSLFHRDQCSFFFSFSLLVLEKFLVVKPCSYKTAKHFTLIWEILLLFITKLCLNCFKLCHVVVCEYTLGLLSLVVHSVTICSQTDTPVCQYLCTFIWQLCNNLKTTELP